MDSFEWNKIAGAVLGTLIFIFVIRLVAEAVYEPEIPAKPGFAVQGVVETAGGAATAPVEEAMPDWGTVLASADVAAGKTVSVKCEQCHDTSSAKTNKIGPPLFGVVGRARASVAGFDYSSAMKAKGGTWTYDELFKFTKSPGAYIPGTKMSFAGLTSAKDRINLIAFLRTNTDSARWRFRRAAAAAPARLRLLLAPPRWLAAPAAAGAAAPAKAGAAARCGAPPKAGAAPGRPARPA